MTVHRFITETTSYDFFIKEPKPPKTVGVIEIHKFGKTTALFGVVNTRAELDALIPLVEARKQELMRTARLGRTGSQKALYLVTIKPYIVDKAERVFNKELLDAQMILRSYERLKKGELTLRTE